MGEADRLTIGAGVPGITLMAKAGEAVAVAARRLVPPGSKVVVMAGPGNNGGDGFVAARSLLDSGYDVVVGLLGDRARLSGDAALAAGAWDGPVAALTPETIKNAHLIIDALFGAGLDRPIEGLAVDVIHAANRSRIPILAVDLPSGVDGLTGEIQGASIRATESVTFFRLKPGHVLMPGRSRAGRISVAEIGIEPWVLDRIVARTFHNVPALWANAVPWPSSSGHKYDRGHAVVVSGPMTRTGAARLAAAGALRAGAGLVSVASPPDALAVHAAHLTAVMILPMNGSDGLSEILADIRRNAVVIGPALGIGEWTRSLVGAALRSPAAAVLDADALTSFAEAPAELFALINERSAPTVLTPHDGEFARLFPDLAALPSKVERARIAAARARAVVVLKGPDTVVAAPDDRAAIADNAPPDLATAGAGDVLAGIVGGLLARSMPAFEAAAAGVWIHGAAGASRRLGLIAEDLPDAIPLVLADLWSRGRTGP
jgi:hydroxyethylthiazole kinase-like uncharacterized protein yjeF